MGAWTVVCAIDMAAGYFVLRMLMPRSGSIPFLLVLAVTTNVVGLAVVGLRPGMIDVHPAGPVLLAGGIAIAAVLRLLRIRAYWGYVAIAGTVSWIGLYFSGLHPALALIPIVPFLPHEPRREPFADVRPDDDVHRFEHQWNGLVQAILFFFGLVNAGVILTAYDTGTWALLLAALAGRPIGILAAVGLAHNLGLRLPGRMTWRHLVIVALATSSGFTFALFFASAALPAGAVLAQIKVGALGTAAGAVLAIVAARVLLPRLRPYAPPRPRAFASSHRY